MALLFSQKYKFEELLNRSESKPVSTLTIKIIKIPTCRTRLDFLMVMIQEIFAFGKRQWQQWHMSTQASTVLPIVPGYERCQIVKDMVTSVAVKVLMVFGFLKT